MRKLKKYFFWIATALYTVWVVFLDDANLLEQRAMSQQLAQLQQENEDYKAKLEVARREYQELMGTPKLREKFAREKYLMKRDKEDIFVLVDANGELLEKP